MDRPSGEGASSMPEENLNLSDSPYQPIEGTVNIAALNKKITTDNAITWNEFKKIHASIDDIKGTLQEVLAAIKAVAVSTASPAAPTIPTTSTPTPTLTTTSAIPDIAEARNPTVPVTNVKQSPTDTPKEPKRTFPRDSQGELDLSQANAWSQQETYPYTKAEMTVKRHLPRAILERDKHRLAATDRRSRAKFEAGWKLRSADATVLPTLRNMQLALQLGGVPYDLWPTRVCQEMSDDFEHVAWWAQTHDADWVTLLEAIIQVLSRRGVLETPLQAFSKMAPSPGEKTLAYAKRVRDTFYTIPVDAVDSSVRSILRYHLQQHLPGVWRTVEYRFDEHNVNRLIQMTVEIADLVDREQQAYQLSSSNPTKSVIEQLTKTPTAHQVSENTMDDTQLAYPTRDLSVTCNKCGLVGHMAANCYTNPRNYMKPSRSSASGQQRAQPTSKQSVQPPRTRTQPGLGKPVTIKGTMFDESARNDMRQTLRIAARKPKIHLIDAAEDLPDDLVDSDDEEAPQYGFDDPLDNYD